ncbi:MAG: J domain-containing protein [Halarcobacter sp.]
MLDNKQYLEEEFIIWNNKLGIRDFVTIGEIDSKKNQAWLDEPYEMVGPFCLEELFLKGQISFEACSVMSLKYWNTNQNRLSNEAFENQFISQKQFQKDINNHNKKRKKIQENLEQTSEKVHRELLCLPLHGILEASQIKAAFKKIAKTAHPDVGGSHELFVEITNAKDSLLK